MITAAPISRAMYALGEFAFLVGFVLLVPVAVLAVGIPIALLVRLLLAVLGIR